MKMKAQHLASPGLPLRGNIRGIQVGLRAPMTPAGRALDPDRLVGLALLLMLPLALWLA